MTESFRISGKTEARYQLAAQRPGESVTFNPNPLTKREVERERRRLTKAGFRVTTHKVGEW